MKNPLLKHSKQQLVEDFLNYELNLSKSKKLRKVIYVFDLIARDDKEFITELYRNILEREPDPEGYNHYLNLLRTNKITKKSLLYSFIKSPEAQKIDVEIKGLKMLRCLSFFFRIRLFFKKMFNKINI